MVEKLFESRIRTGHLCLAIFLSIIFITPVIADTVTLEIKNSQLRVKESVDDNIAIAEEDLSIDFFRDKPFGYSTTIAKVDIKLNFVNKGDGKYLTLGFPMLVMGKTVGGDDALAFAKEHFTVLVNGKPADFKTEYFDNIKNTEWITSGNESNENFMVFWKTFFEPKGQTKIEISYETISNDAMIRSSNPNDYKFRITYPLKTASVWNGPIGLLRITISANTMSEKPEFALIHPTKHRMVGEKIDLEIKNYIPEEDLVFGVAAGRYKDGLSIANMDKFENIRFWYSE